MARDDITGETAWRPVVRAIANGAGKDAFDLELNYEGPHGTAERYLVPKTATPQNGTN